MWGRQGRPQRPLQGWVAVPSPGYTEEGKIQKAKPLASGCVIIPTISFEDAQLSIPKKKIDYP